MQTYDISMLGTLILRFLADSIRRRYQNSREKTGAAELAPTTNVFSNLNNIHIA